MTDTITLSRADAQENLNDYGPTLPTKEDMKFSTKPVIIEARQFFILDKSTHDGVCFGTPDPEGEQYLVGKYWIHRIDGKYEVFDGDYLIRGAQAQVLDVLRSRNFEATYTPVQYLSPDQIATAWNETADPNEWDHASKFANAIFQIAQIKEPSAEPVAWIEHQWSGTGQKYLHFERPNATVRDDVVKPIWIPLYTAAPTIPADHEFWIGVCESLDKKVVAWRVSFNGGKDWTLYEQDPQPSLFDKKEGMIVRALYELEQTHE